MARKRARLSKMKYDEVSFVGAGANQHAHVLITKRWSPDDVNKSGPDLPITDSMALNTNANLANRRGKAPSLRGHQVKCTNAKCGAFFNKNKTSCPTCGARNMKKAPIVSKTIDATVYDYSAAIGESILTILTSSSPDKFAIIGKSIQQYADAIAERVPDWSDHGFVSKSDEKDLDTDITKRLSDFSSTVMDVLGKTNEGNGGGGNVTDLSEEVLKGLPAEVQEHIQDLVAKSAAAEKKLEDMKDGGADDSDENPDGTKKTPEQIAAEEAAKVGKAAPVEEEDIYKGLSPQLVEIMKADRQTIKDQAAIIAKREDEAATQKWTEVAKGFDALVLGDDFGNVLKNVAGKTAPDEMEGILKALRATNEQAKTGKLFSEAGRGGLGDGGSGVSKSSVDAKAEEIVKSEKKPDGSNYTIEQARAKVYERSPDLYTSVKEEGKQ